MLPHSKSMGHIYLDIFTRSISTTFAPIVHKRDAKMNVSLSEIKCRITIKAKSQLFSVSRWREIKKKGTKLFGQIKENRRQSKLRVNSVSRLEGKK